MRLRLVVHVVVSTVLSMSASAQTEIRLQGCGSIADALRAPLSDGFHGRYRDILVSWDDAGSAAAFTSVFAGEADFGVVARRMRPSEVELAMRLGLDLRELILGLDGIAVIVHPANGVQSLSVEQLAALYRGGMARWLGVGGTDAPVRLLSVSEASGVQTVFKGLVFGDAEASFQTGTEYVESTRELIDRIASDRDAIGFVSMSAERSSVRTLAISAESGLAVGAVLPTRASVSSASYPLRHPIQLYMRGEVEPEGALRQFLSFLYLHEGSSLVAAAGLVPIQSFTAAFRSPAGPPGPEVSMTRIDFGFRGSRLDAEARQRLLEVGNVLAESGYGVWITGHEETSEARDGLALARARSVADFLEGQSIDVARMVIDSRGTSEPLTSNAELEGRRRNRRAEVWILPH
jgi:phosphate transport system substrate-binding protein